MMNKKYDLIGFGEIFLRLTPSKNEKGLTVKKQVLGSELDVVSGVSALGLRTGFISCLPGHGISDYILDYLRSCGIDDNLVILSKYEDAKLGLYFSEEEGFPDKNDIVYDRKKAALNQIVLTDIPADIYNNTRLFHTGGATLSLSDNVFRIGLELMKRFKENGVPVSFDVNYEANLWNEAELKTALVKILPCVDVLFISERILRRTLPKKATLKELIRDYSLNFQINTIVVIEQPKLKIKRSRLKQDPDILIYDAQKDTFQSELPDEGGQLNAETSAREDYISCILYGLLK